VDNDCPRCAENERQVAELREKITELDVTVDQPTNLADNDLERELAGWLSSAREADAAAPHSGWRSTLVRAAQTQASTWCESAPRLTMVTCSGLGAAIN
jgi:hypothetical protein